MVTGLLPIRTEPLQVQLQDTAGQVRDVKGPGDEEPAVIGHQRQTPLLLPIRPADPFFAPFEFVGPGVPNQQRHPLTLMLGNVTQLLAHKLSVVQAVTFDHLPVKLLLFL